MAGLQETLDKLTQLLDELKIQIDIFPDNFDALKEILDTPKWPEAINPLLVCDHKSESAKQERARSIIELMIDESLQGTKFLDYGCGDGYCTALAQSEYGASISVGYDINERRSWRTFPKGSLFTTNFEEVVNNAPYDSILIFDVLDHIIDESPEIILYQAKTVLSEHGKIYLRVHPYSSRHATHLYNDLNKAYIHLVFTDEEIRQLMPRPKFQQPSLKVTRPIITYDGFINYAGLEQVSRKDIKTNNVETLFRMPHIARRIMKSLDTNEFPLWQMSLQFIDYKLQHSSVPNYLH